MNFYGFEEVVGAGGVEAAAAIGATDGFEDGIEEFLVEADGRVDESAEGCCDKFHGVWLIGDLSMPRRVACLSQSCSSCWKDAWGARQRRTVTM